MAQPAASATLLVLRKTKLGETDLIITALTDEGIQVRAVAKGARKPGSRLGPGLELYSIARVLLHHGRNLDIITESHRLVANQEARRDVFHSAGAAIIVEFLEKATRDGMEEPRLFSLSSEALRCVGAVEEEGLALICAAALWKMCAQLGFSPQTESCVICGRPSPSSSDTQAQIVFSLAQGGIICENCQSAALADAAGEIAPALIAWIRALIASRFVDLEPLASAEQDSPGAALLALAGEWTRSHLGFRLVSLDFLMQLR